MYEQRTYSCPAQSYPVPPCPIRIQSELIRPLINAIRSLPAPSPREANAHSRRATAACAATRYANHTCRKDMQCKSSHICQSVKQEYLAVILMYDVDRRIEMDNEKHDGGGPMHACIQHSLPYPKRPLPPNPDPPRRPSGRRYPINVPKPGSFLRWSSFFLPTHPSIPFILHTYQPATDDV